MRRTSIAAAGLCLVLGSAAPVSAAPQPPVGTADVTVRAIPERICLTGRSPGYLNFDLVVTNPTPEGLEIEEVRGLLFDERGELIERRLIWQQALDSLGRRRELPANGELVLFNPLLFNSLAKGTSLRFEIKFAGTALAAAPTALTVTPQSCANRRALRLPVAGRVLVYDGYDLFSHHRRSLMWDPKTERIGNSQRYGIDLVVVDEKGTMFRGSGERNEDWLGWGRPVRAPAAGRVVAVHDVQPDNVMVGTLDRWTQRDSRIDSMTSYGNYVIIDHGGSEHSVMGHLRAGSVRVKPGDRVAAGEEVAQIGNSGASGGVHVHYERRTGPRIEGSETLPPYFRGVSVAGGAGNGKSGIALDSGDVVVAR